MNRSWDDMLEKVEREGHCRVCGVSGEITKLDAAHLIPRSRVTKGGEDARNCVPLCHLRCHRAYDEGTLDILPYVTLEEQSYVAGLVGIEEARRRLTNTRVAV